MTIDFSPSYAKSIPKKWIKTVLTTRIWPASLYLDVSKELCVTAHDSCVAAVLFHLQADRLDELTLRLPSPFEMYPFILSAAKTLETLTLEYTESVRQTNLPMFLPSMPYLDRLNVSREDEGPGFVGMETAIIKASKVPAMSLMMDLEGNSANLRILKACGADLTFLYIGHWLDSMAAPLTSLRELYCLDMESSDPIFPASLLNLSVDIGCITTPCKAWVERVKQQCTTLRKIRLLHFDIDDVRDICSDWRVIAREMATACNQFHLKLVDDSDNVISLDALLGHPEDEAAGEEWIDDEGSASEGSPQESGL